MYSINATFVTTCNTTTVRAFDFIVPRPSTSINVKRISITRIYFVFFWESKNDRLNESVMLIYMHNNAMRSSNEPTTLHCVESYLYYVILVNTKIFSEEWNEGEKKTDNIIIYIVENIKFIYTSLTSCSYLFCSEWKWLIYFPTMYVYCIYRVISKAPTKLSNCLERGETSLVLIVLDCDLCEVRAYKFIYKLIRINAVTGSYRRSTWIRYQKKIYWSGTKYKCITKNIRQYNVPTRT